MQCIEGDGGSADANTMQMELSGNHAAAVVSKLAEPEQQNDACH